MLFNLYNISSNHQNPAELKIFIMPEALLSVRKAMKPKIYNCVADLDPTVGLCTDLALLLIRIRLRIQAYNKTDQQQVRPVGEEPGDHCLHPSLDAPGPQHWL